MKCMKNLKKILIATFFIVINTCFFSYTTSNHVALVSMPKCGTHLLLKLILATDDFIGVTGRRRFFLLDEEIINSFIKNQRLILLSHAIYNNENSSKLADDSIKKIFIYRDPRDQIVSAAFWIKTIPRVSESEWSIEELIDELISGGSSIWSTIFLSDEPWKNLENITSFYNLYLPWRFEPNVYVTSFEKLIGAKGGGSDEVQLNEIINIAFHIGKNLSLSEAKVIANLLFGGTLTFREGKIGSWKEYFLEKHKVAFKKVAGQLLIDLGYEKDLNW